MAKTPEALRREADELEAAAREKAIKERCSYSGVEWTRNGKAKAVYHEFVPCTGNRYGQPHEESYTDDYGSRVSCSGCNGSGQNFVTHYIRVPEYDAPEAPKEPV